MNVVKRIQVAVLDLLMDLISPIVQMDLIWSLSISTISFIFLFSLGVAIVFYGFKSLLAQQLILNGFGVMFLWVPCDCRFGEIIFLVCFILFTHTHFERWYFLYGFSIVSVLIFYYSCCGMKYGFLYRTMISSVFSDWLCFD